MILAEKMPLLPGRLGLPGPDETKAAGASIGLALKEGPAGAFLVTLEGPLGAGKTTFCQGLAEAMGAKAGEAVSPTFTLCNVYQAQRPIFHLDLYRLDPGRAAEEFEGAGLEDCLDGLCLVEWPERLSQLFWPDERLELIFEPLGAGRLLSARGASPAAARIWRAATIAAGGVGQG